MPLLHLINVIVHVITGVAALGIGFFLLANRKGTGEHRHWGRIFCYFSLLVCFSAAIGTLFFRFIPLFAVLTVLVTYQLISGWRSIYTRELGPGFIDGTWTFIALVLSGVLTTILFPVPDNAGVVVYSSLGGLVAILLYDTVRWMFPRHWFHKLWKYEHGYKLISSLFAMLSALVGNVVRVGQPWSQIAPSVVGALVICYFFYKLYRQDLIQRTVSETRA